MAGTAAAGAAAGMFMIGCIGFPVAGALLGASAAAYVAGTRPEGDAAGDFARQTGKTVANVSTGIANFDKQHNISGKTMSFLKAGASKVSEMNAKYHVTEKVGNATKQV